MKFFSIMKFSTIILIIFLLPMVNYAQDSYAVNPFVENCIDSGLVKKYKKYIDTNRIKIDFNKITGKATFYSASLHGTLTANGERYRNNKFTAASNLFLLNSIVKVTSLKNGKSVLVRINDRMHPYMLKKGRIIDLSGVAAKKLAMTNHGDGIVQVIVEVIDKSEVNPKNEN